MGKPAINKQFAPQFDFSHEMREAAQRFSDTRERLDKAPRDTSRAEENALAADFRQARKAFIATPSKTIDDLRAKFDVVQYDMDQLPDIEDMLAFFTDLQQLSSHRCSPFFRPDEWLGWFERHNGGWVERDGEIVFLLPDQPDDSWAEDLMVDLRARGGCEAVKALIRERAKAGDT